MAVELGRRGIATGIHDPISLPDQPPLGEPAAHRRRRKGPAEVARDWAHRELSRPIFPGMTGEELEAVAAASSASVPVGQVSRQLGTF